MNNKKIAFIIDKIELKYFEFNKLVTSFWLIMEFNKRGYEVYITTQNELSLKGNIPQAFMYKTQLTGSKGNYDLIKEKEPELINLEEFKMVLFRPDPPVDIDYINSTFILDYIDTSKTIVVNNPSGIRKANEKLYINNFPNVIPENITTSSAKLIKEFIEKHGEIIIKPLNRCFSKGVYYLKKGDKNINTIIEAATNSGSTVIMAQKYLHKIKDGDKRVIMIGGEVYDECVVKVAGDGDFKFNTHRDEFFKKGELTSADREACKVIAPKLLEDGLLLVGLDIIDGQVIEVNVTSPCFFIKEINEMFNVNLEVKIVDYLESLIA